MGAKLKDIGAQLDMNESTTYQRHRRLLAKIAILAEDLLNEPRPRQTAGLSAVTMLEVGAFAIGGWPHAAINGTDLGFEFRQSEVEP